MCVTKNEHFLKRLSVDVVVVDVVDTKAMVTVVVVVVIIL